MLCGKTGWMEEHHVFPASNRNKSEQYCLKALLCGESCHRTGKMAVHNCKETADELKRHFQVKFMVSRETSVSGFIGEFGRNYLGSDYYEDERSYPVNITAFSGRLVRDPELRYTASNKAVCSFTVAVSRPGTKDKTDYINCVTWDKKAEFVSRYFHRGQRIEVSGVITSRAYEKDGDKRHVTEVRVDQVFFGDSKKDNDESKQSSSPDTFEEADDDIDLPF